MRIFEELNQSLEIKNREIVLRVKEEGIEFLKRIKQKKESRKQNQVSNTKYLEKEKDPIQPQPHA